MTQRRPLNLAPHWAALLLCAGVVAPSALDAHPHAWIDLRVTLVFSPERDLQSMQQEWAFDPSYSHLLLQETDAHEPGLEIGEALLRIRERFLANLRDYDYFTELTAGTDRLTVPDARDGDLVWQDRRLHLRFTLPLPGNRPVTDDSFGYRVYDPTYWIEVLHDPNDVIHLDGGHGCEARLEPPRPDGWMVAYAATLDREQRNPIENLGRAFAETVRLHCVE